MLSVLAVWTANANRLTAALTLALLIGSAARADKSDFLVNDDGGHTEQSRPRVAVAGDGGFVVAWVDKREANSDIYLQRFDADGTSIGDNTRVNDDPGTAYQAEPAIGVDLSGLYSVVWKDYRNGYYPFDPDIFFQRFDSAVSPVGLNRNLTTEKPDSLKESPDIALSMWGDGVVVWADYRNSNWDIYGQRISSVGALIGSNFRVNDDGSSVQQHAPRVSIAPEGWFVVTWYDNRWGSDDIFVQRFDSLGNKLGINVRVNSDGSEVRQAFPDVAADGSGCFTVVWVDWRNGTYPNNPDIYARKYDTTMTPLTAEMRVNKDGTTRAQREPTIAADRMGNVAIIWSDSVGSSRDIIGQMIDVEGIIREENFQANAESDSAQLQADVALDGRYRYATWADRRNGNWDIYASITKYNDPTLVASPPALRFEMEVGGSLPEPQNLLVEHAGYNPLHFTITSSVDWCTMTPSSGITPAEVSVAIVDSSLACGSYFGSLNLIDTDNNDSTVMLSVRLDVTAPVLMLSADTLWLRAFSEIDDTVVGDISVSNSGSGSFSWVATESTDWLELSDYSGVPPTCVQVMAVTSSLSEGTYIEPVIFEATGAVGSPDTLWVLLDVVTSQPYLAVTPDSICVRTADPVSVEELLIVQNRGTGILAWSATVSDLWLVADRATGGAGDTVRLTIDTAGLSVGVHVTSVEFVDSASFNISQSVPFVLEVVGMPYLAVTPDSIYVRTADPASVEELLIVQNSGTGILAWSATVSDSWLVADRAAGGAGDTVRLTIDTTGLSVGVHVTSVEFVDSASFNISQSVPFVLEVVGMPYLLVTPDSIYVPTADPASVEELLIVQNSGTGILAWSATVSDSWLVADRAAGGAGDTVRLTIDTAGLSVGVHVTSVEFVDSASFNISQSVPFVLEIPDIKEDTLRLGSVQLQVEQAASLPVELRLVNEVRKATVVIEFDTTAVRVDSVTFGPEMATIMSTGYDIDSSAGRLLLQVTADPPDTFAIPGSYLLAELHITAGNVIGTFDIDTTRFDTTMTRFVTSEGIVLTPVVLAGTIVIAEATDTDETNPASLPERFTLGQNSPNPFNLSSTIEYELPVRSEFRLEVFNILGQRVATLAAGVSSAGHYAVEWNGRFDNGRTAPSGIYFYRLKSGWTSLVRKMVLVK